jgi:hypothetical protein
MNSLNQQYEAEQRRLRVELAARKAIILQLLKDAGVAQATMEYDACGDSGQIHKIKAFDASGKDVSPRLKGKTRSGETLVETLDELAWQVLQHFHDGFENGEGGCGEIIVDVAAGTMMLDHNDRIVETVNTMTEV